MRSLFYISLAAGALVIPLTVSAGKVGTIRTDVEPLSATPNYSLNSTDLRFVAFKAIVENVGGNTATGVLYTSDVTVANATELVTFHSVEGLDPATCTTTATSVDCSFGQMRPGDKREFIVVFQSPVKSAAAPADNKVTYTAVTYFAEGTGGPKSQPVNSTGKDETFATLQAATGASANSVVPAARPASRCSRCRTTCSPPR